MSKVAIVSYKIKDGQADENRKYVEAVFSKLKEASPAGVRYASTISDDKLTFIHVAFFESDEANKALTELAEFKEFQKDLKSRCDILPNAQFCEIVGSYNLF